MEAELIGGIIVAIGTAGLVLNRLGLLHFGKPPERHVPVAGPSCGDLACKQEIMTTLSGKLDKDPETSGAHHMSAEVKSKLAGFREAKLQDAMCETNIERLRLEFQKVIRTELFETEKRIIAAVNGHSKG